jgi:hypothetical protein
MGCENLGVKELVILTVLTYRLNNISGNQV